MQNLKRVKEKKQYMKYFYNATYKIIQKNNYIHNHLTLFDKKFFYHLKHYGEKVGLDFFLYRNNDKKQNPKISIIIPIYNTEKFIEDCLKSLIAQTFKDFEII